MCRWIAYRGRPVFLESLLFEPENSLISQSLRCRKATVLTNGDGFGIGWYGDRDTPALYRETLPAWNDRNLRSLAHHIRSPLFFAHVRASTGTATARINCHPFSHGRWMFMHNGQMATLEEVVKHYSEVSADRLHSDGVPLVRALGLSSEEKGDLIAFLRSLDVEAAPLPPAPPVCP